MPSLLEVLVTSNPSKPTNPKQIPKRPANPKIINLIINRILTYATVA